MSEYQRFEFQAVDRPLTANEQTALRGYSSRASISSSRFAVDYSWGSFKGDASEWMEKYFDAFMYEANWGTRELALRLPRKALSLRTARQYCYTDGASARAAGDNVILEFGFDGDGDGGDWVDEDAGALSAILPIRAELARGDLRALYLAWLGDVRDGQIDPDEKEPPCPAGLGQLSAALEAFAEFLRVDPGLIAAAAAASPKLPKGEDQAVRTWVAALPEREKTALLTRVAAGDGKVGAELQRRFRASRPSSVKPKAPKRRTAGELLEAAEALA